MIPGFKSLWMMPCKCMYYTAFRIPFIIFEASSSVNFYPPYLLAFISSASCPLFINSIPKNILPPISLIYRYNIYLFIKNYLIKLHV
jgi:hypothetical protein